MASSVVPATNNSGTTRPDTLKYFSERIPATYAGIDLAHPGLFTGIRGRQIAGRFTLIETVPVPSPPNGMPWSPPSSRPCGCTTTCPAPCPRSAPTCTSAPAG